MDHAVFNPEPTSTGIRISVNRIIAYSAAIRELDNGRYDKSLADGMSIQACIMEAAESGFRLSAMGREGFNLLHDGFIEQIQTEGMPDMPVMH